MKHTHHTLAALGLLSLLTLSTSLFGAAATPADSAALRETYVNGLKTISDTNAASSRTSNLLNIVEAGANQQSQALTGMENRLLQARQTLNNLQNAVQNLTTDGTTLLAQRDRIQDRFTTLQTALSDTRMLLAGATKAVDALVTSADKSGQVIERQLAAQSVTELQQLAARLQRYAANAEQTRRQIDLEYTLFKGLQNRPATITTDINTALNELKTTTDQIAKQRTSVSALLTRLSKDTAGLSDKYNVFGQTIENFRVAQVSVLRRWLLDGPPAGELPALSINDILENTFEPPTMIGNAAEGRMMASKAYAAAAPVSREALEESTILSKSSHGDIDMTQISVETIQNHKRAQWYLDMLHRLVTFADRSQGEASGWLSSTNNWRNQLSNCTTVLAQQRGSLSSLQLEQETIATTVNLIGKQADTTTSEISAAATYITNQTTELQRITDDLKKRSAD